MAVVFTISKLPMDGGTAARVRRVRQGGGRAMDSMGGPKVAQIDIGRAKATLKYLRSTL